MDDGSPVIPLAQLRGVKIANGALDMRLWQVHSGDGRWIGSVDELLVDPATMDVRYLDVEVENLLVTGRERHVLIPVGHARPDAERSHTVVVDSLPARAVAGLPGYDRGTVLHGSGAEYERPFAVEPDAAPAKLDLPIRVQPPRLVRAIRVATPATARRGHNPRPAMIVAGAKQAVDPAEERATATGRKAASLAA